MTKFLCEIFIFKKKFIFHVRCQKIFLLKKYLLKLLIMPNPAQKIILLNLAQKIILLNLARYSSINNPDKSCLFLPIIDLARTCKSIFLDLIKKSTCSFLQVPTSHTC